MEHLGYPTPSSPAASAVMRANLKRDTRPETTIRSILHRRGYRFRKDALLRLGEVRTRPDVLFSRQRVAVYIDGCFWHRCPEHGVRPRVNQPYWGPKLDGNVERDRRTDNALREAGWTVLRLWEHTPVDAAVRLIEDALTPPPAVL